MVRRPVLVALLVLLVGVGVAHADVRYDGFSGGRQASWNTSRDHARVTYWAFEDFRFRCSDQTRSHLARFTSRGERRVGLGRRGAFAYSTRLAPGRVARAGHRTRRGVVRLRMSGRVGRDTVRGRFEVRFSAPHLRCSSGALRFTAYRHGTRRAPFRNRSTATGSYGGGVRGFPALSLRVLAPRRLVERVHARVRVPCANGGIFATSILLGPARIRAGRVADRHRFRSRLRGGQHVEDTLAVTGTFVRERRAYRFRGRVTVRARVLRGRRLVTRCGASRRFTARA